MTQLVDDDIGDVEEIEGDLIDLEAFVIEGHGSRHRPRAGPVATCTAATRRRLSPEDRQARNGTYGSGA
jgi:hypothetical protein